MGIVVALAASLVAGSAAAAHPAASAVSARTASGSAPISCRPGRYRVRAGDTLFSIARRFHSSVAALARANALDPNDILLAGAILRIPSAGCEARRSGSSGAGEPAGTLAVSLNRAVAVPGVSRARTGVVVVDLDSSSVIYALNRELPLEPASTEKLPVAMTALQRLGGSFRTHTDVLVQGSLVRGTLRGQLVLKGYGDPTLTSTGLAALARAVRVRGITAVTDGVIGDESYFDSLRTCPGWKASFAKLESPLLSALVVDRGLLDGTATDRPALAAAILFTRALQKAGVSVGGRPAAGSAASTAVELVRRASPPLTSLLSVMDTWSDNFIAEMLLKQLGAQLAASGSTGAGAAVVSATLAADDVPLAGVHIVDGSGLSSLNRLTARSLAAMLETLWHEPDLRTLLNTFAVAGSTGTLRHRLLSVRGRDLIRGKTGTTDNSSALAGFVGSRFAFVILNNGSPVNWQAAHLLQDRVAGALLAEVAA
jgi:D-alanyl-D-alanine carboxypeptidase/D-alanyl-D-alanine-endopeptidase (penicillin-binding protein 4)